MITLYGGHHASMADLKEAVGLIKTCDIICLESDRVRIRETIRGFTLNPLALYQRLLMRVNGITENPMIIFRDVAYRHDKEVFLIDDLGKVNIIDMYKDMARNDGRKYMTKRNKDMAQALVEISTNNPGKSILFIGGAAHIGGMTKQLNGFRYSQVTAIIGKDGHKALRLVKRLGGERLIT